MSTTEIVMDTFTTKSGSSKNEIPIPILKDQADDEKKDKSYYYNKLYHAALNDDWSTARYIYEKYPHYITANISKEEGTALHVAAAADSSMFVLGLVEKMNEKDLDIRNGAHNTAFCLVAESGKLALAKAMLTKNCKLPFISGKDWKYPIEMAAESGHKNMVEFLYDSTKQLDLPAYYLPRMFKTLINFGFYDAEIIKTLYRAAFKGNWSKAKDIYDKCPIYITARISEGGDTALHIAAAADSSTFVQQLVEMMNKEDLAIRNGDRNTGFCLVAESGKLELARAMLKKNCELPLISGKESKYPIEMATLSGHKEMMNFLYDFTKELPFKEDYHTKLFRTLTRNGFYDVALNLLKKHRDLATTKAYRYDDYGWYDKTALHILARTPMSSSNLANQNQEGILKRSFNLCRKLTVSGSNKFPHKKLHPQALELVKCLWEQVKDWNADWISEVIFLAASKGNIEFLTIIIRDYPGLISKANQKEQSIFHVAVLNRQKDIFKLIHEISPSITNPILKSKNYERNNILHLAGMLAPPHRLNTVSGVALQLQEELLWFEEVSKIVHPLDAEAENRDRKTPRALFTETHAELKDKGEKWMKETANSCMIVATLIATVVFAAAFTVPGGIKEDTGTPHFVQNISFIIFIVSDAVSLVSSACSILTFLSILTSRYAEEDFLWVLPGKLFVGLLTLFLSIAAMMVVFCVTIFIVCKDGMIWVPILVSVIASLPVILFTKHQRRLLFDIARSTFKICSLFQSSQHTLFGDEGKETKPKKGNEFGCDACCYCRVRSCW